MEQISVCSLFVDDGTSFATVRCYSNIVQKLLELSETEWFDLEEAVKQEGDIFMTAVILYSFSFLTILYSLLFCTLNYKNLKRKISISYCFIIMF